ncbi:hypothetical protein L3X38_030075 [Prunus dulcis]|uniref:Uncharacterized protein n=1 Tax=Prunus dulcis TaxID=3755 RepID=A0AAD4YIS5_PRUDU|nr:hypothetical protein L3X38_030075 [Prunus dulcis]
MLLPGLEQVWPLGKAIHALNSGSSLFLIIKTFATGVILATGFIQLLPDAFEHLTSPCLKENPWVKFLFTGCVAMVAAIGIFVTLLKLGRGTNLKNHRGNYDEA